MSLDPKRLIELLRIAEHGSYTKAAAALHVSQPALSSGIAALERKLGVKLLDRGQKGAKLTEFGEILVQHARSLDAVIGRAEQDMGRRKRGVEGTLAVGATPAAMVLLVPEIIHRLTHDAPNVAVTIIEDVDDTLVEQLRCEKLDLVVSPLRNEPDKTDLGAEALFADPLFVVMPPGHPMAHYKSLSLAQLRDAGWIMPNEHTTTAREIEAIFSVANIPWPTGAITCNSVAAIKALIMRTERVSIMSKQLVIAERNAGQLACVPLRNAKPIRHIGVRWRNRSEWSPLAIRFMALARKVARDVARLN